MYLHLGQWTMVPCQQVVGIFDLDSTSWAFKTREFLRRAEEEGRTRWICEDLPRSFVLVGGRKEPPVVYFSQLSPGTLHRRMERGLWELGMEQKDGKDPL